MASATRFQVRAECEGETFCADVRYRPARHGSWVACEAPEPAEIDVLALFHGDGRDARWEDLAVDSEALWTALLDAADEVYYGCRRLPPECDPHDAGPTTEESLALERFALGDD